MKKFIFISGSFVLIFGFLFLGFKLYLKSNTIIWDETDFVYSEEIVMTTPKYNDTSGAWWGHNQYKLASINESIYFIEYDNSALDLSNSSSDNPFTCTITSIVEGIKTELDSVPCNSPGIILADVTNNKLYAIIVEPTGPASTGGFGWTGESTTFMYEYDVNTITYNITLVEKHQVTPSISDGKIRQGADIDELGNVAIAYGDYSGYIQLYVFNFQTRVWMHYNYLSNSDNDTLMYCNVQIKNTNNVYILCQQDTAINGRVLYQYVKFFAFEENVWSEKMIADYRNHERAESEDTLVLNSDLVLIEEDIHIITTAQNFIEVTHLVYRDNEYETIDMSKLPPSTENIKLIVFDDTTYYVIYYKKLSTCTIDIVNVDNFESVFSISGVPNKHYIYPHVTNQNEILILVYPNDDNDGVLMYLERK